MLGPVQGLVQPILKHYCIGKFRAYMEKKKFPIFDKLLLFFDRNFEGFR